jgi:hypothetical protein
MRLSSGKISKAKRQGPRELRISPESQKALKERLESPAAHQEQARVQAS